jgi:hypothetical protein
LLAIEAFAEKVFMDICDGLERTPVLGWSTWSFLRQHPTAAQMKAQALALHEVGLQKIGYEYAADVKAWSDALRQSGRPMVLDVTQGHLTIAIA